MGVARLTIGSALVAAGLTIGVATAAVASSQVAVWNMSDTGSKMTDSSGHGHTGSLANVRTGQPGYSGTGFGFFSHPSYVVVPNATDLNPGTSTFSFTVHVKFSSRPSSSVGDYDVLRKGLSSTDGGSYKLEILRAGNAYCNFRGSSAEGSVSSGSNLANNAWHTLTCTRTSSAVKLTVDGKSYSKSVKTGSISNTGPLYIGAKSSGGADQYTGYLDSASVSKG